MYIELTTQKGHTYVYLRETLRENGVLKKRTVEKFGRKDLLDQTRPGFVDELIDTYGLAASKRKKELVRRTAMGNEGKINDWVTSGGGFNHLLFSYAMLPLWNLWRDGLRLDYRLNYLQKKQPEVKFDASRATAWMVMHKLVEPVSILSAYNNRAWFAGNFLDGMNLDSLYYCLDFLQANKEGIVKWVNSRTAELTGRKDYAMVFYDVTNFYYEATLTDADLNRVDLIGLAENEEFLAPYLDTIPDKNGTIHLDRVADAKIRRKIEKLIYLRLRGPSKEHRFDLPLVSIALVIDDDGFPIDYEIYSGGRSEFDSFPDSIDKLKKKYKIDNCLVVADRGLNSADNLIKLKDSNLGFLFAQKVSNFKKEVRSDYLNLDNFSVCPAINGDGEVIKDSQGNDVELFKYREIKNFTKISSKTGGKIDCDLTITWSKSRYKRDKFLLDQDIQRANQAVANKEKIYSKNRSWKHLVDTTKVDKENIATALDLSMIERKKQECGFAAYVYRNDPTSQTVPAPRQIASAYHKLVKIEECFRILKSALKLRPARVFNPAHIRGYMLVCYLGLCMIRWLEYRLNKLNVHMTVESMQRALQNAFLQVNRVPGMEDPVFSKPKSMKQAYRKLMVRKDSGHITHKSVEQYLSEGPGEEFGHEVTMDNIMEACGCQPLDSFFDRQTLGRAVHLRLLNNSDLFDELAMDELGLTTPPAQNQATPESSQGLATS